MGMMVHDKRLENALYLFIYHYLFIYIPSVHKRLINLKDMELVMCLMLS
jgi:hypothetical protein